MLTAGLLLSASVCQAQTAHLWNDPSGWWGAHFNYSPKAAQMYGANEFSFDTFGSYTAGEHHLGDLFDTNIRHGKWGGGVGLNYFFTRNLGIGGDMNIPADGGNFVNDVDGNLIARVPIGQSGLAPYIFGGGGRLFDPTYAWFGDAGAGVEVRLNPVTGIFTDARYVWANKTSDSILFRAGVRFVF